MWRYKGSKGRKYEVGNICFLSFVVHLSLMPYMDKICTYSYYLWIHTYIHTGVYIQRESRGKLYGGRNKTSKREQEK